MENICQRQVILTQPVMYYGEYIQRQVILTQPVMYYGEYIKYYKLY